MQADPIWSLYTQSVESKDSIKSFVCIFNAKALSLVVNSKYSKVKSNNSDKSWSKVPFLAFHCSNQAIILNFS